MKKAIELRYMPTGTFSKEGAAGAPPGQHHADRNPTPRFLTAVQKVPATEPAEPLDRGVVGEEHRDEGEEELLAERLVRITGEPVRAHCAQGTAAASSDDRPRRAAGPSASCPARKRRTRVPLDSPAALRALVRDA